MEHWGITLAWIFFSHPEKNATKVVVGNFELIVDKKVVGPPWDVIENFSVLPYGTIFSRS